MLRVTSLVFACASASCSTYSLGDFDAEKAVRRSSEGAPLLTADREAVRGCADTIVSGFKRMENVDTLWVVGGDGDLAQPLFWDAHVEALAKAVSQKQVPAVTKSFEELLRVEPRDCDSSQPYALVVSSFQREAWASGKRIRELKQLPGSCRVGFLSKVPLGIPAVNSVQAGNRVSLKVSNPGQLPPLQFEEDAAFLEDDDDEGPSRAFPFADDSASVACTGLFPGSGVELLYARHYSDADLALMARPAPAATLDAESKLDNLQATAFPESPIYPLLQIVAATGELSLATIKEKVGAARASTGSANSALNFSALLSLRDFHILELISRGLVSLVDESSDPESARLRMPEAVRRGVVQRSKDTLISNIRRLGLPCKALEHDVTHSSGSSFNVTCLRAATLSN